VICRDLTGDRDREMVIRLTCCTGGSLTPWAIFKHDRSGEGDMNYLAIRDNVFRIQILGRRVRTDLP
jgi:hypothetical protein